MAFNGSGTYIPISPPDFPAVAGTTIRASQYNTQINDMAAALTQVVCKDGQTIPTADLPMGAFRHSNVGAATARTQYARVAEVQDGALHWLTSVAGTNTITALATLSMSAYAAGQRFVLAVAGTNTGAVTLNINSIGAKDVKDSLGNALAAGELPTGRVIELVYDGTEFRVLSWNVPKATENFIAKTSATGSFPLPAGTTAQRDGSPAVGTVRFNTSLVQFEGYTGSGWGSLGGGLPSGAVQAFAMTAVPTGWLECNGSAVSRTIYSALFAAIGTTFGAGDGTTTFNLPDLRGEFVRGWDNGRGVDSGRTFGSAQADELKSHTHAADGWSAATTNSVYDGSIDGSYNAGGVDRNYVQSPVTAATGGVETRPRNIALMYCIKT